MPSALRNQSYNQNILAQNRCKYNLCVKQMYLIHRYQRRNLLQLVDIIFYLWFCIDNIRNRLSSYYIIVFQRFDKRFFTLIILSSTVITRSRSTFDVRSEFLSLTYFRINPSNNNAAAIIVMARIISFLFHIISFFRYPPVLSMNFHLSQDLFFTGII